MAVTLRYVIPALSATVLGGCGGKPYEGKSLAELQQMLRDPSPTVQAQGAFGLSRMGPAAKNAVPALIECLKKDPLVRQNAALALGAIGPEAASECVPALVELLHDSEWTVRRQATAALGELGPSAADALPELKKLSRDKDSLVRKAAAEAIKKIRRNQPRTSTNAVSPQPIASRNALSNMGSEFARQERTPNALAKI
jgi:HEAT repeat protein